MEEKPIEIRRFLLYVKSDQLFVWLQHSSHNTELEAIGALPAGRAGYIVDTDTGDVVRHLGDWEQDVPTGPSGLGPHGAYASWWSGIVLSGGVNYDGDPIL